MPRDRSQEAATWHRLYDLSLWRHPTNGLRARQLAKEPLCAWCAARGVIAPATDVHHKVPHKGDMVLFRDPENLESLCGPCHDIDAKRIETGGRPRQILDADGWPLDG